MRKIDHAKRYSAEDIKFIRQMGVPYGEDWINRNAEEHGYDPSTGEDVPEDTVTRTTVGAEGAGPQPTPIDPATGAPRLVNPTEADPQDDDGDDGPLDDYDKWKVPELEDEVKIRNEMEGLTPVEVTGTGTDGKILKADMIAGLRAWDKRHPNALD